MTRATAHHPEKPMPIGRRTLLAGLPALAVAAGGLRDYAHAAAPAGQTLRAAITGFSVINTLDPGKAAVNPEFFIIWGVYNTLVKFTPEMKIVGDLAESWTNPDPTTWEFKLKHGVKFHDGSEMTAEDVVFTFQRLADPAFGSPVHKKMAPVTEVIAVDPYTVRIKTDKPFSPLLTYLTNTRTSTQIVCKKAVLAMGNDQYGRTPVGTGPWKLTDWRPNERLTFAAHTGYFEPGLPRSSILEVPLIRDDSSAINALEAGGLEFVNATPYADSERLQKMPSVVFSSMPGLNARFTALNIQKPPFDDVHFRRAVSMSINREAYVQAVVFGQAVPSQGYIPKAIGWAFDETPHEYAQFNPARAKEELAKSKYGPGTEAVITGFPDAWWKRMTEVFVDMANKVLGVKFRVELVDARTAFTRWSANDGQAWPTGWIALCDPDEYLFDCFHTTGWRNFTKYSNPAVDQLLEQARQELDRETKGGALYKQAERLIAEDCPSIFLMNTFSDSAVLAKVKGFEHTPFDGFGAQLAPMVAT
jgi:peptide/nickel transport system substrate-binding protein